MPTNWDDVAGDAAAQTDKELEAGLNKLMSADTAKLFPNPIDREKVNALIKTIRQETNYNKRAAAFKGILVTIGSDLAKAVKAAMLTLAVFFLVGTGCAMAATISSPIAFAVEEAPAASSSLFNFGDFFQAARAGYAIDQHGKLTDVYYAGFQSYHNKAGVDFVTLNIGYEGATKRPAFITGARLDNIIPLIWGGSWGKAHVTTAKLPTIEFSTFISVWPKSMDNLWDLDARYGLALAIGFPRP